MDDLLESTKVLVDMARSGGVLTPPIPSAAVDCMEWCVEEIERLRKRESDLVSELLGRMARESQELGLK